MEAVSALVPALILVASGATLLGVSGRPRAVAVVWIGLIGSTVAHLILWENRARSWGWIESDRLGILLGLWILVGVALSLPLLARAWERDISGCYRLVLFASAGMLLAVSTRNLLVVFVAVEMIFHALSVFSGRAKLGRFPAVAAAGSMLLGSALFRVVSGSFDVAFVESALVSRDSVIGVISALALGLFVVGLFIKLVPPLLRSGMPGAPLALTAQIALFGVLLRMRGWLLVMGDVFEVILAVAALVALIVGNSWALRRSDPHRVLSASLSVHVGLIALGVIAGGEEGRAAVIFSLLVLVVTGLGAWSSSVGLDSSSHGTWRGKGWTHPVRTVALSLFLFSLSGIPLTMGFVGRFYVLSVSVPAIHLGLVAVVLLNLWVCFYYTMKLVLELFAEAQKTDEADSRLGKGLTAVVALCIFVVVSVGVWPEPCLSLAMQAAREFY